MLSQATQTMKYLLFPIFFITFCKSTSGQDVEFKLKPVKKDYYTWITSLNEGPVKWLAEPESETEGRAYRICITTSEIYNNLYIEQVILGTEGCCKKIAWKKELDLYDLFKEFKLTGEVTNVEFSKWLDNTTCYLSIQERTYSLSIEGSSVMVKLIE